MSLEIIKSECFPTRGVNYADNISRLDPTKVSDARNFLFQQNQCRTRPGLTTGLSLGSVVGPLVFAENVLFNSSNKALFINSAGKIYIYGAGAEVTGAGTTFGAAFHHNATSIQNSIVIGNNTGGLITSGSVVYTVQAAAPFRYVVGHKGRAIAAYRLSGGSAAINPRTFAWSTLGSLSSWTSTDGSAGEAAVADIYDEITGLGVLHDIVVILRKTGIHLAYPTGTLPLPYNIQSFILKGRGCFYPFTAAWSEEEAMYVGQDDVYAFDLQRQRPIGYEIRDILLPLMKGDTPVLYRGFFTYYQAGNFKRRLYNLVPVEGDGFASSLGQPHFTYDCLDQTWSIHSYGTAWAVAWNFSVIGQTDYGCGFTTTGATPLASYWDDAVATEVAAYLTRYMGRADTPEFDYIVEDVLVRNQDLGAANLTASIVGTSSQGVTTTAATRSIGTANNSKWVRNFLSRGTTNLRQSGNEFVLTLTSQAGKRCILDYIALHLTRQGEYRGR